MESAPLRFMRWGFFVESTRGLFYDLVVLGVGMIGGEDTTDSGQTALQVNDRLQYSDTEDVRATTG